MNWIPDKSYDPPAEKRAPHCPICDYIPEVVYRNMSGDIVGCNNCMDECDPYEQDECWEYGEE